MTLPLFPITARINGCKRTLQGAVGSTISPFTGTEQVQDWGGEWWEYEISVGVTKGLEARALAGFLAKLGGKKNAFAMLEPTIDQSWVTSTVLVKGAGQSGNQLITDGWPPTWTVMYAGFIFSLGTDIDERVYCVTEDCVADGTGTATLKFVPALRSVPSDNAPVEVMEPKVVLRAVSAIPTQVATSDSFTFSFSAREDI